ncbi:GNAT family N-acetyltransferase [Plantibacter sp. RU18]
MGPIDVTWRPLTVADASQVHALRGRAGIIDHPSVVISIDETNNDLTREELDIEQDTLGAVAPHGTLVAYGIVVRPSTAETVVRVGLDGQVDPRWRNMGLGRRLLAWQQARGEQILATHDEPLPGWLTSTANETSTQTIRLLQHGGFNVRRWWLELRRGLRHPINATVLDPAFRITPYAKTHADQVRDASNEAFRDHWGSQPASRTDWNTYDNLTIARHDLSFIAWEANEVAAFLTTTVNPEEFEQLGFTFGYIELLGTRPHYRGHGIARALLTHALTAYRAAGLTHAMLDVDSDSPTGAVALYESVGFHTHNRSLTLVRQY